jgi:hypothetical protein
MCPLGMPCCPALLLRSVRSAACWLFVLHFFPCAQTQVLVTKGPDMHLSQKNTMTVVARQEIMKPFCKCFSPTP